MVTGLTFTNGPVVALDKGDYRNNETVHVTGEGYIPFEPLTVQVTRPDGSIVTGDGTETPGSDAVTTDADGKFAYDYIIRNGVRADYLVDVLDASGDLGGRNLVHGQRRLRPEPRHQLRRRAIARRRLIILTVTGTVTAGNSIIVGFAGIEARTSR